MILNALVEYAERENLSEDLDYQERPVDFLVRIDKKGNLVALIDQRDEKGKSGRMRVPRVPKRTVGIVPQFLYDNAAYVFGLKPGAKEERLAKQTEAFRAEVARAASATKDEALLALQCFLENRDKQ
ncbi:MAG: type I-C CRISPR-associated protein Cas8c/Csd1, partial [Myxococcales bacterium]|nr:type I-C CRISPR-associated protein Cas8c/Csd1 [Myxococcales bacterium]